MYLITGLQNSWKFNNWLYESVYASSAISGAICIWSQTYHFCHLSECFCDSLALGPGNSGRIQNTTAHGNLVSNRFSTLSLLGAQNTRNCFWVCIIHYCRWHGLVLESCGFTLWFSSRGLPTLYTVSYPTTDNSNIGYVQDQGWAWLEPQPGPATPSSPALGLSKLADFWVPVFGLEYHSQVWNVLPLEPVEA